MKDAIDEMFDLTEKIEKLDRNDPLVKVLEERLKEVRNNIWK